MHLAAYLTHITASPHLNVIKFYPVIPALSRVWQPFWTNRKAVVRESNGRIGQSLRFLHYLHNIYMEEKSSEEELQYCNRKFAIL